jgi:hypothetical protein
MIVEAYSCNCDDGPIAPHILPLYVLLIAPFRRR